MSVRLHLESFSPSALAILCGPHNEVLKRVESYFGVALHGRPGDWQIEGAESGHAARALQTLAAKAKAGRLDHTDIEGVLGDMRVSSEADNDEDDVGILAAGKRRVQGKTRNQRQYISAMQSNTLTLSVGPAGTGKTYLAVAAAVVALTSHQVERIILTRPAVEAGERLGFLPGDMQQKVDPYLRPLFDALSDMLGFEKMSAMMESGRIEIAPLAYMRGRTLNHAYIILDEAQNTTREQMKMFLTRLGEGAKMVVTGDVTQVDLEHKRNSGLLHALHVLGDLEDVGICRLTGRDVVRHRLVEHIVSAYEAVETDTSDTKKA